LPPNLTPKQNNILTELHSNQDVIIKPANKGSAQS